MPKTNTTTDSHDRGRFSAKRKTEAILRLLRGEDLDRVRPTNNVDSDARSV